MSAPRQFFVGGNFKMNPTSWKACTQLLDGLLAAEIDSKTEVVIAVPALYLLPAQQYIKDNSKSASAKIELSAQNCYSEEKGAFTGEISPHMLVDAKINWTLIGHSERRVLFKDTSEAVAKKTATAVSQGLKVVLCIGETLEEREADKTMAVCESQVQAVIGTIKEADWKNVVVAYEPVWAIGTGKVATSAQAQEVHAELRKFIAKQVSQKVADEVRIIYGGSVTASNSQELAGQADIDGFLVGGASLKPEFADICNSRK